MGGGIVKNRRVLLYVQHLLGMGHLVRASRIARAMAGAGLEVTVVTGGCPVAGFPGEGLPTISLPPVKMGRAGFSALEDCEGNPVDDAFRERRAGLLLQALERVEPGAIVIEAFPFGRRMMRFELLPFLEKATARRDRPLIMCSVRDILQENAKPGRNEETVALLRSRFDCVLVHGDPAFARLDETFPLASLVRERIRYTGFVAGPVPSAPRVPYGIVISAGGGAAGSHLVAAAAEVLPTFAEKRRCCIVAGPHYTDDALDRLRRSLPQHVDAFAFRSDLPELLRGAELSVSQAGYNTMCDLLQAGCRSLLIPFAQDGETEQPRRAAKLARLGLAHVLDEVHLSPSRLAGAMSAALQAPKPEPGKIDLDGAARTAALIGEALAAA